MPGTIEQKGAMEMKKTGVLLAVAVACMLLPAAGARGETISVSGKSGAFPIDTRTGALVIEDVKSSFCSGAYGMKGASKATFLHGVPARVGFTVTMRGAVVQPKRLLVRGKQYAGDRFELDVGTLRVGESLKVVAYGEVDGQEVESEPFRVNLDVASVPFPGWIGGVAGALSEYAQDIAAGRSDLVAAALSIEWKKESTKRLPWWLPLERVDVAPSLAPSAHYSLRNGTCTIQIGNVGQNWSGGHMFRRSNGQFFKWGNQSWGWDAHGEVKMVWNPVRKKWDWESAGIAGTLQGELKNIVFNTVVMGVPVFVAPILKGSINPAVRIYGLGGGADLELSATSRNFPTVGGKAGVGTYPIIAGYGLLSGSGELDARFGGPRGNDLSFGMYATAGLGVAVLGLTPEITWDSSTFWLFGEKAGKPAPKGLAEMMATVAWVPMDRGYRKSVRGAGRFATGSYPNPGPAVARGAGVDWVAYLQDDGTREDADRTQIVLQRGTGGTWWNAEKVWDDGTADWMPALGVGNDGTAFLSWANARAGTDGTSLASVARGLELAVGVRDAGTGRWSVRNLTDDDSADFMPLVSAAENGTAMVAWLKTAPGALFGSAETPTSVMASRWDGRSWSTPAVVAGGVGMVVGLDLAYDGTDACAVWTYDGDGNAETAGDMAVGSSVWKDGKWSAPKAMATGLPCATPVVARTVVGDIPRCVWNDEGVLVERVADASSTAGKATVVWDGAVPVDARAVHGADGATALVWTEGNDEENLPNAPVVMMHDAGMGAWGGPVSVAKAEAGRLARAVSASVGTNGILMAWESVAATTNSAGSVEFGATEMRVESMAAAANPGVKTDGFAFAENEVIAGDVTGVKVTVRNTGLKAVSNATLRVWVGDGIAADTAGRTELFGEGDKPVVLDLPGGAEVEATVRWVAVDSMTNLTFVARIEPKAGTADSDTGDNEASWHPGRASLSLEDARCEVVGAVVRLLTATVRNNGLAGAEAGTAVSFRLDSPDGRELGRDVAGALRAGSSHGYDAGIAWNMAGGSWTGSWVTVYAVLETGHEETDASTAVPILVMTPRDRDGDGLLDGEEEAMETDPNKADTNGDGTNDYEHVYVYFTDPLAGMESAYTTTTPVPVPYAWLDGYPESLAAHAGDYEAFAWDMAANGTNRVWECYVAGTNPTDGNEAFRAVLSFPDGKPLVEPRPDWSVDGTRVYRVEGKKSAEDKDWEDVTDRDDWDGEGWRLFRMKVEMAK